MITFANKYRCVKLFELLNNDRMLAKIKGEDDSSYWTLMDTSGNIKTIPDDTQGILNKQNWAQIQSKDRLIVLTTNCYGETSYTFSVAII